MTGRICHGMYQSHNDTDRIWINNYGAVFRKERESGRLKEWARTLNVIEQDLATDMLEK